MPVLKIKQNGEWVNIAGGSDNDSLTVELEDANIGTPNTVNAGTLNGKTEDMLSVLRAVEATKLGGHTAEDFLRPKAGFIYPLAGSVVPDGFLLCDGAEYERTEFPELFAAIGTIYGEGDGSTTFNVPNLQTRVPVGAGNGYGLGTVGGEATHTLTVDEMPSHCHTMLYSGGTDSSWGYNYSSNGGTTSAQTTGNGGIGLTGGSQPHNNMQPYTVVNYIIATGKDTGVSVSDIIMGAQAIPLGVEYGGTGATNAEDALKNLGGLSMELLWENASPTSTFASQIMDVVVNENEGVAIEFRNTHDQPILSRFELFTHGIVYEFFSADSYGKLRSRKAILRNNKIEFTDAYAYNTYGSYEKDNTTMLPFRIYGIKGVSA